MLGILVNKKNYYYCHYYRLNEENVDARHTETGSMGNISTDGVRTPVGRARFSVVKHVVLWTPRAVRKYDRTRPVRSTRRPAVSAAPSKSLPS